MKNIKSLKELIVLAATTFQDEKHKDVNEVYASEDGFTFVEENRARVHCKSIPGLKFHAITRAQALQAVEDLEVVVNTDDIDKDQSNTPEDNELTGLKVQYEELFGKQAHHNIGVEKLKTLIAEKLAGPDDNNLDVQKSEENKKESE